MSLPVVVLRSNDVCFQGILRSFGAIGVECISVTFDWEGSKPWLSESSRFFNRNIQITNPGEDPKVAVDQLISVGKNLFEEYGEKLFLIPSSDTNMALIELEAENLQKYFKFIGSKDFSKFRSDVFDKSKTFERLSDTKVSVPLTKSCLKKDDIENVVENMIYPCVYKPSKKDFSQSFYSKHDGLKAVSVETKEELREKLFKEMELGFDLVVQEKIVFSSAAEEIPFYVYVDGDGKIRMAVSAIKERIDPPPFGTATVLRLNYEEELLPHAQAVVDEMKWRGLLMIEFIKDKKDGMWKVIELNGRPWLLIDFFRRSGFNFLSYLYKDCYFNLDDVEGYKKPSWSFSKTPVHFELSSLDREGAFKGVEGLKKLISSYVGEKSFYYLDPEDESPGLMELRCLTSIANLQDYLKVQKEFSCEY